MSGRPMRSAREAAINDAARIRIRVFSLGVWTLGLIALVALAAVAVPRLAPPEVQAEMGRFFAPDNDNREHKVLSPEDIRDAAPQIIWDGDLSGGTAGGYVVLPGGSQTFALVTDTTELLWLYQQRGTDPRAEDETFGLPLASMRTLVIVGDREPSLLWVMPSDKPWSATLNAVTSKEPVDRMARGVGPAVVAMPDRPGGAYLEFEGDGNFVVKAVRFGQSETIVNVIDDWEARASWTGEGPGVLSIEYAQGLWQATFDDDVPIPSSPPTETPAPTSSDTSAPTGAADPARAATGSAA